MRVHTSRVLRSSAEMLFRGLTLGWLVGVVGCGSVDTPYEEPIGEARSRASADGTQVDPAEAEAAASASASAPAANEKTQRIAEKLLAGGIGWIPERKAFAVITTFTQEGTGTGVLASVATEADNYQNEKILCAPELDCAQDANKLMAEAQSWIDKEGLGNALVLEVTDLKPSGGQPAADVGAIGGRLLWKRDHFDVVRGTKSTSMAKAEFAKEFVATPAQVTASPDGSLLIALFQMDPGANYGKGFNQHVDVKVFKVP